MTTVDRVQPGAPASPFDAWRTRDIVVAAVIGVVFGVVFAAWNQLYAALAWLPLPFADWIYGMWLVPAVLAPLVIRKPGAALLAEMVAAGLSFFLGSQWGPDALLSGFVQGAAAELVFAFVGYRRWGLLVVAAAAVASAIGAWIHDWVIAYSEVSLDLQLLRLAFMAVSAVVIAALGSMALARSLDRAGVLEGFAGSGGRTG